MPGTFSDDRNKLTGNIPVFIKSGQFIENPFK
jgi:hypothetical protein